MAVSLTESAAKHVRSCIEKDARAVGLRVGVRRAGCSGFAYTLDFAEGINESDHVFESFGIKVVVDDKSLPLLDGTVVDYGREGINEAFKFRNPKVKSECGCGESFSV